MSRKYAIVQKSVSHYRHPLFEGLNNLDSIELTVFHSDETLKEQSYSFRTEYVKSSTIGPFVVQHNLKKQLSSFDTILLMFDLHYLSCFDVIFDGALARKTYLWSHAYGRKSFLLPLKARLIKQARGVVIYYKENQGHYLQAGVSPTKIFESSNTVLVSNSGFDECKRKDSFLYVGRLQPRKRLDQLIEAFSSIYDRHRNLTLNIIGDGAIREELIQKAASVSASSAIKFHGACYDPVVLKNYYASAYAYVSPGHVGLGVLHAFAYGCPVITNSDAYHAPEVVNLEHNQNSLLFSNTHSSLLSEMRKLVNTPKMSTNLGRAGYELYTTKRTMKTMITNLASLP